MTDMNSDDSDCEILNKSNIITTGYKLLREEVETVIIHHESKNDDQTLTKFFNGESRNMSCDKLLTFENSRHNDSKLPSLKKSKSASFNFKQLELRSPLLVKKNEVLVKNQTPKIENKINVIYDIPKQLSANSEEIESEPVQSRINR